MTDPFVYHSPIPARVARGRLYGRRRNRLTGIVHMLLVLAASALLSVPLAAQISIDTARGLVGKEVVVAFRYVGPEELAPASTVEMSGIFRLSNPTVFLPQRFIAPEGVRIIDSTRKNDVDSIYSFSLRLEVDRAVAPGDTLFLLAGEALAGSDSVTLLTIAEGTFNAETLPPGTQGVIVTTSIGTRFPYVRFATLEPGYPNPTTIGRTVTFGFRIDKRSDVTFKIYDLLGQEIEIDELGVLDHGTYIYRFTPDPGFPSGTFFVRLLTNSGQALEWVRVLR